MTAPANTAEPTHKPAPHQGPEQTPVAPTRTLLLLGLVRRLITYGKELTATLQRRPSTETIIKAGLNFGIVNVAVILARISRALQLARALETRLEARAARPEPARPAAAPSSPRKPREPRSASPQQDPKPALPTLPTAEQIAAHLRHRPVHAVLAEICGNLGLMPDNPLWADVQDAILEFRGSGMGLFKAYFARTRTPRFYPWDSPQMTPERLLQIWEAPPASLATASTGPP